MSKINKTQRVYVRFSPEDLSRVEEAAKKMGYVAERGKKSVQVATYIHDRATSKEDCLIKIDGINEVIDEYNVLRTTRKMISYFCYLIETANEDIQNDPNLKAKYGDIPYLQKEYLDHMENLCNEVNISQKKIFKELVKINKKLNEMEAKDGLLL